jgi:hypothetical protein
MTALKIPIISGRILQAGVVPRASTDVGAGIKKDSSPILSSNPHVLVITKNTNLMSQSRSQPILTCI